MLYINGKRFNTKSTDSNYEHQALVDEYKKVIREAKDYYGQYLVIETKLRPHPDEKTGYPVYPGTKGLLLRTTIINDDNVEEWIYSENTLGKKEGSDELDVKVPNLLIEKGQFNIDITRNPDLVFYVLKCGKVGRTEAEGKKFHFRDEAAKSQSNAETRRIQHKVGYMIYTAISEPNLKTLAKSWGIRDVDLKHIDTVREELYQKVEQQEKAKQTGGVVQRGYKEFLESADVKANDKVAALCVDAEEKGFLHYDAEERSWMIDYKDGRSLYRIKELSGGEFGDPLGALVDFLLASPDSLHKVEMVLNKPHLHARPPIPEGTDITMEMVQKETNVPKLKKMIKMIDPDIDTPRDMNGDDAKEVLFRLLAASAVG